MPIIQPNRQLTPGTVGCVTFAHTSFKAIETDLAAWYLMPGARQVISIQTYPVVVNYGNATKVEWFTVIHFQNFI